VTSGSKPTVFISSTIQDFQDLRSALKLWLEESGFEVWLSEYNDMDKNPGANTFEACFETIRRADFYVLLIGECRGSLFDAKHGVSVTQQEYRVAYETFARQGRPMPVLFVRSWVKNVLDGWVKSKAQGSPPFRHARFVQQFLTEVAKEQEATEAVKGIGPYPLANWLHAFHDFEGIIGALRVALSLRADIPLQRVLAGIGLDLEISLSRLVQKHRLTLAEGRPIREELKKMLMDRGLEEGTANGILDGYEADWPFPAHWYFHSVTREVTLDVSNMVPVELDRQQTVWLSMYLFVGTVQPDALWLGSLREAVHSGALLRYDPQTRRFDETELSLAAIELLREAEVYQGRYATARPIIDALLEPLASANKLKEPRFVLSWQQAVIIWGLHQTQVNLYRRAASLYAYLKGRKDNPTAESLLPTTPLGPDMEEQLKRERASRVDIREWSDEIPGFWNL
jgi:hypothetical protein